MEKYAVWFRLLLKKNLKKKTIYIQSFILIVLLIFLQQIHFPDGSNTKIGVCINDNDIAEKIYDDLSEKTHTYEVVEYENRTSLEKAVASGIVECGFYFTDEFDDDFKAGKLKKIVEFLTTPMSAKAELIRENFYISFLKEYSQVILLKSEEELYGQSSMERYENILSLNEQYMLGDELFELNICYVDTDKQEENQSKRTFFLQGMYGMFVFLFMFLSYNRENESKVANFRAILNKNDRLIFDIQDLVSTAFLPALSGLVIILCSNETRGVGREIFATMVLLAVSTIWILIFSYLCKNEMNYLAMFLVVSIIQLIVCPIFFDVTRYFKVLLYIRYLFPLGTYLLL